VFHSNILKQPPISCQSRTGQSPACVSGNTLAAINYNGAERAALLKQTQWKCQKCTLGKGGCSRTDDPLRNNGTLQVSFLTPSVDAIKQHAHSSRKVERNTLLQARLTTSCPATCGLPGRRINPVPPRGAGQLAECDLSNISHHTWLLILNTLVLNLC